MEFRELWSSAIEEASKLFNDLQREVGYKGYKVLTIGKLVVLTLRNEHEKKDERHQLVAALQIHSQCYGRRITLDREMGEGGQPPKRGPIGLQLPPCRSDIKISDGVKEGKREGWIRVIDCHDFGAQVRNEGQDVAVDGRPVMSLVDVSISCRSDPNPTRIQPESLHNLWRNLSGSNNHVDTDQVRTTPPSSAGIKISVASMAIRESRMIARPCETGSSSLKLRSNPDGSG
ncbi:hypothetical protein DFH09DRAFT_1109899 [Mycena vulgaris]|nr:hypothetical protein DFH09DRAFT_1109899 [Mycena vulgaris]